MTTIQAIALAFLLTCIFICAGVLQTFWLKSTFSKRWAYPLDFGWRVRGRRVFGDNKTLRGFIVWVPAVTLGFWVTGLGLRFLHPSWLEPLPWSLASVAWVRAGFVTSMAYLLAELPNSFMKRQLDVPAGGHATSRLGRTLNYIIDQSDSISGGLFGLSLVFSVNFAFCITALTLGICLHSLFNVWFFHLGMKDRPA